MFKGACQFPICVPVLHSHRLPRLLVLPGRNFVFDQRVSLQPDPSAADVVVGRCFSCSLPYDELCGSRVCAVCRDLVLACGVCQRDGAEYRK
jgi:predicted sulfurtransferase